MKLSDFAPQFGTLWAAGATSSTLQYPLLSGTSLSTGRASIASGFPAANFTPPAAGGVYPWGADWNGALRTLSVSAQNYEAGNVPVWSAEMANNISGYPNCALVQYGGVYYVSMADANTTTPGASGASWQSLFASVQNGRWLNTSVLTASGTYTVPAGVTRIRVRVQGAGGAGGGSADNTSGTGSSAGSSGSAGGYAEAIFAVTAGQTISYALGAGGVGTTAQNGSNGGASTFGPVGSLTQIVCPGGFGGFAGGQAAANAAYATPAPQQAPLPTGSNIVFSQSGAAGLPGIAVLGTAAAQSGGNSFLGSGGGGEVSYATTNHVPGANAQGWGGGGGAHANQQGPQNAGGAGANGIILIEEYS